LYVKISIGSRNGMARSIWQQSIFIEAFVIKDLRCLEEYVEANELNLNPYFNRNNMHLDSRFEIFS